MDFTPEMKQKMRNIFKNHKEGYAMQLRQAADMAEMCESITALKGVIDVHLETEKKVVLVLTICEAFEMIQFQNNGRSEFSGVTIDQFKKNLKALATKAQEILSEMNKETHTEEDILGMFNDDRD